MRRRRRSAGVQNKRSDSGQHRDVEGLLLSALAPSRPNWGCALPCGGSRSQRAEWAPRPLPRLERRARRQTSPRLLPVAASRCSRASSNILLVVSSSPFIQMQLGVVRATWISNCRFFEQRRGSQSERGRGRAWGRRAARECGEALGQAGETGVMRGCAGRVWPTICAHTHCLPAYS